ncbi:MAG: lipoprotein signal peptidase, partial [Sediminibacterium sp.]|nr:lipoprotein signal peptidase [Sediminibacterium sp.]
VIMDQIMKIYIKLHFHLGEEHNIIGHWFRLHFIENEGMAWGLKWGGNTGKIILTSFRLIAVIVGFFYLKTFFSKKYKPAFYVLLACIYAGAIGNLIDSIFYGVIFSESQYFTFEAAKFLPANGGYTSLFLGRVVDMLYFPIIQIEHLPTWIPFIGGSSFEFFSPVFNLADMAISVGVISIWVFQKRILKSDLNN